MGRDGLLFPARHGAQLAPSTLYKVYYPARIKAGRPDLRFHDLRHTGAVLAASTGATLAELMARLGHSTPAAALRYQHAAEQRDRVIADALSKLVTGEVTPIKRGERNPRKRRKAGQSKTSLVRSQYRPPFIAAQAGHRQIMLCSVPTTCLPHMTAAWQGVWPTPLRLAVPEGRWFARRLQQPLASGLHAWRPQRWVLGPIAAPPADEHAGCGCGRTVHLHQKIGDWRCSLGSLAGQAAPYLEAWIMDEPSATGAGGGSRALSSREQVILASIERGLASTDPAFAKIMSSDVSIRYSPFFVRRTSLFGLGDGDHHGDRCPGLSVVVGGPCGARGDVRVAGGAAVGYRTPRLQLIRGAQR